MNQQTQNMIQRHAALRASIARDYATRRQTPPAVLNELQALEQKASAMLTPGELEMAQRASASLQAQFAHQLHQNDAQRSAQDNLYYKDTLAKELSGGLTADQVAAARDGIPVPMKGSSFRPKQAKASVTQLLKQSGLGDVKYETFTRAADRVEELRRHGKDPLAHLTKTFGADKAREALRAIDGYNASGVGLAIGLAEGRDSPDEMVAPDEATIRRAQLVEATVEAASRDDETMGFLAEGGSSTREFYERYHDPEELDGDAERHYSIAKAFDQVEAEHSAAERESYSGAYYDEDELKESASAL